MRRRGLAAAKAVENAEDIASYFARGWDEATIRRTLGLSRREFDDAMRVMLRRSQNEKTAWARYLAALAADLRQLDTIRRRALAANPPAFAAAASAVRAMAELRQRAIQVGQTLGVYRHVQAEPPRRLGEDERPNLANLEASEGDPDIERWATFTLGGEADELAEALDDATPRTEPLELETTAEDLGPSAEGTATARVE